MEILEMLLSEYPVRKTKAQKQAFRDRMTEVCREMGYTAIPDEKGFSRNIVIGAPDRADVIFTAHYDTPPRLPFPNACTPKNIVVFILIQLMMVLCMVGAGALVGLITGLLTNSFIIGFETGDFVVVALCMLMIFGPANPNCANDNTSGVATVLEIMRRLPAEDRSKAAFILFDNEEKGLLGSAGFASKHREIKKSKLIINMDCVGDGDTILFFANKQTRALPVYEKLTSVLHKEDRRTILMNDMEKSIYPSDQANFKLGMAVCACNKGERIGYYFARIHTPKDTVCDPVNIEVIADDLAAFTDAL